MKERCRDLVGKRAIVKWRGASLYPAETRVHLDQTWRGKFGGAIGFGAPYCCWLSRDQFDVIEEPKTPHAVCPGCALRWRTLPSPAFSIAPDRPECWVCGAKP